MSKNDGYAELSAELNRQYESEYTKWVGGMTARQREKLAELGVDAPEVDSYEAHGQPDRDVSEWHDLAAPTVMQPDHFGDWLAERFEIAPATAQALARFICELVECEADKRKATQLNRIVAALLRPGNPTVRNHALAFAADLHVLNGLGRNQSEAARRIGTTRSNFNKEHNAWRDLLDLPRSSTSKSDEARRRYSSDKKANHWRHKQKEKQQ